MAIAVTGTVNKSRNSTSTSITLNCAGGGDFTTTPNAGDLIIVWLTVSDYGGPGCGGFPVLNIPSGWTQFDVTYPDVNAFQFGVIYYHYASASETTYTFTDMTSSVQNTNMGIFAVSLSGAANPFTQDPASSSVSLRNQTASPQAITATAATSAGSCNITYWISEIASATGTPAYNTPTGTPALTGSLQFGLPGTSANGQFAGGTMCAMAWTLAEGTTAVVDSVSVASGTTIASWGVYTLNIKQATVVAAKGSPTAMLMGV